jgi:hypothetical protein
VQDGRSALEDANIAVGATDKVTVYIQPYLDIKVTDANVQDNNITEITLDITPMVKILASTADRPATLIWDKRCRNGPGTGIEYPYSCDN